MKNNFNNKVTIILIIMVTIIMIMITIMIMIIMMIIVIIITLLIINYKMLNLYLVLVQSYLKVLKKTDTLFLRHHRQDLHTSQSLRIQMSRTIDWASKAGMSGFCLFGHLVHAPSPCS